MEIKHIVCTRFSFFSKEELIQRLPLLKEIVIPSLKKQTNQNFTWAIIINWDHLDIITEEIDYDFVPLYSMEEYRALVNIQGFNLQTRHDSDDGLSEDYIQKIHDAVTPHLSKERVLIHFKVMKMDYKSGRKWARERQYNSKTASMFLTIYQRDKPIDLFIYQYSHDQMPKVVRFQKIITMPIGDCFWVMHNFQNHKSEDKLRRGDYSINDRLKAISS